ncbi:FK506-binding protein 2 [Argonauta hians]
MQRLKPNIVVPFILLCVFLDTLCYCEEQGKKPVDKKIPLNDESLHDVKVDILKAAEKCDRKVKRGDLLKVKYKGTLLDGTVFDDTEKHGKHFQFQIDGGTMIKGWQIGLKGACLGEIRKLTIPPKYGFGEYGNPGGVPGNAVLIFNIEIVSIEDGPEIPDTFSAIDADRDKKLSKDEVRIFFYQQDLEFGSTNHLESTDLMFKYEDTDKDGYISHFEYNGPKHSEL